MRLKRFLVENIFGSDVYDAYRADYTWRSNQLAHLLLGFVLGATFSSSWTVDRVTSFFGLSNQDTAVPVLIGVALVIPLLKEGVDYWLAVATHGRVFPLRRAELLGDMVADAAFWWTGIWAAAWTSFGGEWLLAFAVGSAAMAAVVGWRYLAEKVNLNRTGLPFYVRLATFPSEVPITACARAVVQAFVVEPEADLAIVGPERSFKTTLGAAIACELLRRARVRYIRGFSLTEELTSIGSGFLTENDALNPLRPWPLNEASMFVVDDISLDEVKAGGCLLNWRDRLSNLNHRAPVVWILRSEGGTEPSEQEWAKLRISEPQIIRLRRPDDEPSLTASLPTRLLARAAEVKS